MGMRVGRQTDGTALERPGAPAPGPGGPGQLWVWGGGTDLTTKGLFLSLQIISQTWPYLSMIMENKVWEKLEPKIWKKSTHLRTFAFTKLYFGQKVGRLTVQCCLRPQPPPAPPSL